MLNTEKLKTQNEAKRSLRLKRDLKLKTLLLASRPQFLTASISPVLVGSALGFAVAGTFNWPLFLLALFSIMALHGGANITNDYFDSASGNDWINKNVTPFSGGRQFIQKSILTPTETLITGIFFLSIGAILGIIILVITKSIFILAIGLAGLSGAFFYTAPPLKIGYRGIGEIVIGILFGLLPAYGAYYLQTARIDIFPLPAGYIVGVLVYLIILANEFPDLPADSAVNKKNLVVRFGVPAGVWFYRIPLITTFISAASSLLISHSMLWSCILYFLLGLPVALAAINFINQETLSTPGPTQHRACAITIIFHLVGSLALTAGYIIWAFINTNLA